MSSSEGCTIAESRHGERALLIVRGTIDELSDISLLARVREPVMVDIEGVRRINSFGVRSWFYALREIPSSVPLTFVRCPPVMIDQANMVAGFFGHGVVESFFAPMICDPCRRRKQMLVMASDYREKRALEACHCERCKEPMELDEWEERFFAFIDD